MKTKKKELDVDYIGGEAPLTPAEEKALSEYFQKKKALKKHEKIKSSKTKKIQSSNLVES